jgi:CRISPR-associated protein Csm4
MYGYIHGFDRLQNIIQNINNIKFIAFSDGFINDLIPKPLVLPHSFNDKELKDAKDYKKTEYISVDFLNLKRKNLNDEEIFKFYLESKNKSIWGCEKAYAEVNTLKNSINRMTGTTQEGLLYTSDEVYFKGDVSIALYIKYNSEIISKDEVLDIINKIGIIGFGKDASTGKGKFKIAEGDNSITENPEELRLFEGANAFMALSHGIPGFSGEKPDCSINFGRIITKFPKHGGFLSNGDYFKNPFIAYKPGSTFLFDDDNSKKEIYGTVVNNISRHGENHIQGTFLMPYFIKI